MDRDGECTREPFKRQRGSASQSVRAEEEELLGGSGGITAPMQVVALAQALSTAVITPIKRLVAALPAQLAAALRKYDENEAVRLAAAAEETHLERQIERCRTCTEIGNLEAFDYEATANRVFCLNCQRY
eukprot:3061851-Prymnesium_polylepis.1